MSEDNKIQNEEELWDMLSNPVTDGKSEKPAKTVTASKPEGKFSRPRTAPQAETAPSPRKIDGFFVTCMVGVAAVSVAATLVLGGMLGGNQPSSGNQPVIQPPVAGENVSSAELDALKVENAELRALLEQQKTQIKDLQSDLLTLMGSEEYLATVPSNPEEGNEVIDAQVEAYAIFAQIQEAYADFDRAKLEELIPEMDARLAYLSSDALNNYYKILEYVEQPSNG